MRYLLLTIIFLTQLASAEVYRSVDKDGNVVFSDEASPDAETVIIPEVQTIPPPKVGGRYEAPPPKEEFYRELLVTSPAHDSTIRDNTGNISVGVSVDPSLQGGHQLVLYMDGQEVSSGRQLSFTLNNVDRGTHQLRAVIKDAKGRIVKSSKSSSFHLHRHFKRPGA